MDDNSYQQWSDVLAELRRARNENLRVKAQAGERNFRAKDLYDNIMVNVDQILQQWWTFEKQFWDEHPSENLPAEISNVKSELEAVIDFECEAIRRDIDGLQATSSFDSGDLKKGEAEFTRFIDDLRKNYGMKIDSLLAQSKKTAALPPQNFAPLRHRPHRVSGQAQRSGWGTFSMFILGIILGSGASFYFWDMANRVKEESAARQADYQRKTRDLEDSLAVLQDYYSQLANGKIRNLPQLKRVIDPIKKSYARKRKKVELEFSAKRENLIRRVAAGDRLDRSLEKLEKQQKSKLAALEAAEEEKLAPYLDQEQILRDLLGR